MDKFGALEEFGLEPREAKIYVKLLELGQATASQLAKSLEILRPTVYDILDKMIQKGIVSYSISSGRKVFAAVEPGVLEQLLENKKRILEEFIPELKSISKISKFKPLVETYIGVKGLKTIYDDMLTVKEDIYHIFNYEEYVKLFHLFFIKNFIKKRIEKGIWFRAIVNKIKEKELERSDPKLLREIRTLQMLEDFKMAIVIYGKKSGFFTFTETPMGIVIENELITHSFKVLFNYLWQRGKE
ncbi:hypothetical protein DRJ17_02285 [Candidatus Woesearchaeota archaeon]|nr:MAG: hypothetical protein DRJ17_02285 [Candidatus Woesearchaeota archaeon]